LFGLQKYEKVLRTIRAGTFLVQPPKTTINILPTERDNPPAQHFYKKLFRAFLPRILTIAVLMAVFFGGLAFLIFDLLDFTGEQSRTNVRDSFLIGGVFVLFILLSSCLPVFFFGAIHRAKVRRSPYQDRLDAYEIEHTRSLDLALPVEKATTFCIEAARSLGKIKIKAQSPEQITLSAGFVWALFPGSSIIFALQKLDEGHSQITLTTRPYSRTALLDFGKNLFLIEDLLERLRSK
jgi:hypothetical protein